MTPLACELGPYVKYLRPVLPLGSSGDPLKPGTLLRVAINAPLSRLFDYLWHEPVAVGSRVAVPFGRRRETGLVMELPIESDVPASKLKQATAILDESPILTEDDLWLIRFTSEYYHHPIGEVVAAALPARLRQGQPLAATIEMVAPAADLSPESIDALKRRAPRQAELLSALLSRGPTSAESLDVLLPNWRRLKKALLDKGLNQLTEEPAETSTDEPLPPSAGPPLHDEQREALTTIQPAGGFATTLIDGITGSGKTEIYLQAMQETLAAGRQVLVLVPEIGLTPQFVERLEARLGQRPALLHSALTDTERLDAWRRARDGSAGVVLGTRSSIFVPLARPGLVVVDEEHDVSFKQQEGLRYSARDLAIARAKRLDIPVVLGSATPSFDSLKRARDGAYRLARLEQRAGEARPPRLRLIDINRFRSDDGLSPPLTDAIATHTSKGGQALIFLNRRGFAPTLICNECGEVAECGRCDSRMTVHRREGLLACHHCGSRRALDQTCAKCGGQTVPLGEGTERLEDALKARFPKQTITRIDSDSTRLKGSMDEALGKATRGESSILVGTQMLSKGHHFPNLTLVGIVNADQGLFSTDFRGAERLAQNLVQVAGRAGRERRQGEVLIQTAFPDNPFWPALLEGGYRRVAELGLAEREGAGWPPFSRLALLRASSVKREDAMNFLSRAAEIARAKVSDAGAVRILGPVSAPMERLAGRYRAQLFQSQDRQPLHKLLFRLQRALEIDKRSRRARWSIDVDPIELF